MFAELLKVLEVALGADVSFVLTTREDGSLVASAATERSFLGSVWRSAALFDRVAAGQPAAVFDLEDVPEWSEQPEQRRAHAKSALHVPLRTGQGTALFIFAHPQRGFFAQRHLRLARRFAPLASQALAYSDLQRTVLERDRFFALAIDMMCIGGGEGNFKQLNPQWQRVLGFSTEELKSRPIIRFVHPDDRQMIQDHLAALSRTSDTVTFEARFLHRDGSYRSLELKSSGFAEEGLCYSVARDITEHKRAMRSAPGTGTTSRCWSRSAQAS